MVVQIIFFVTMYPILFLMYFFLRPAGELKNGYCFAVGMKRDWIGQKEVVEIQEGYRREAKRLLIVLALIPFVTWVLPGFAIPLTVWMLWMVAVCILPMIPVARANGRLKRWKRAQGFSTSVFSETYTEMKNAGAVRRVKFLPFLIPMLLSGAVAAGSLAYFGRRDLPAYGVVVVSFALLTALCYGVALWMDRQKTQVISNDSDVNVNYTRAKKSLWKNTWLGMAWTNTVYTAVTAVVFVINRSTVVALVWATLVYTAALVWLLLLHMKKSDRIDAHYEEKREEPYDAAADDDAWIGGVIYYNKKDKRTMVSQRIGIGTTTNLATTTGKVLDMIGLVMIVVVIPFCCIWVMLEEYTPLQLAVKDAALVAEHLGVAYELPLADIEKITLIEELPRLRKLNGNGMENIYEGTFRDGAERCEVFLNPQNGVFLQIETAEETYYMSAAEDAATVEIYEAVAR